MRTGSDGKGLALEPDDVEAHVTQSIVVRLWLENPGAGSTPSYWRAHITHVPTGEGQTVDSLGAIAGFCATRLMAVNARLRWYERIWVRCARWSGR